MLLSQDIRKLTQTKNLLGFSGGVDSSALFHLLVEAKVPFDLAIVGYGRRSQAEEEKKYAQELSEQYCKKLYFSEINLSDSNFEHEARKARYAFFESLIREHGYEMLILAHQLNDRMEWFVMQMTKGAGLAEMVGMQKEEPREGYTVFRPLLQTPRSRIEVYLRQHHIRYFEDESNADPKHFRNQIRHTCTNELVDAYADGIKRSFDYLDSDKSLLLGNTRIRRYKQLTLITQAPSMRTLLYHVDQALKRLGVVASAAQKQEILKHPSCVLSGKAVIARTGHGTYVSPYTKPVMDKAFKEACRKEKIPPLIRGYLYTAGIAPHIPGS